MNKEEIKEQIKKNDMQDTGLKDKKGNKIYKGDVVMNYAMRGTVIFENGMFTTDSSSKDDFGLRQPLAVHDKIVRLGNIFVDDFKTLNPSYEEWQEIEKF